jgi:hypothetical protein
MACREINVLGDFSSMEIKNRRYICFGIKGRVNYGKVH